MESDAASLSLAATAAATGGDAEDVGGAQPPAKEGGARSAMVHCKPPRCAQGRSSPSAAGGGGAGAARGGSGADAAAGRMTMKVRDYGDVGH